MSPATPSGRSRQAARLRQQLHPTPELPFARLLDRDTIAQALRAAKVRFRDRLFAPFVTLRVFLSQVLDPDHSCRAAVSRFLAWRAAQQLPPCAADTGAYCKARQLLPELEEVCRRRREVIARYRIEERPHRWGPRARKRWQKPYPPLQQPRRTPGTRLPDRTCT